MNTKKILTTIFASLGIKNKRKINFFTKFFELLK